MRMGDGAMSGPIGKSCFHSITEEVWVRRGRGGGGEGGRVILCERKQAALLRGRKGTPREVLFLESILFHSFIHVSRMLSNHIKTVVIPPKKIFSFLWSIKDDLAVKTLGIYIICCKDGMVYFEPTHHSIETRI
jgi:hypothetical protein